MASEPGCCRLTDRPSSDWARWRSSSTSAKAGLRATSAMIAMAWGSLPVMTLSVTDDDSWPAAESRLAPSDSVSRAICWAPRVLVPSVSMPAVMLAAPASPGGSAQAPVLTVRSAVTRGRSEDFATITLSPLARVFSAG